MNDVIILSWHCRSTVEHFSFFEAQRFGKYISAGRVSQHFRRALFKGGVAAIATEGFKSSVGLNCSWQSKVRYHNTI